MKKHEQTIAGMSILFVTIFLVTHLIVINAQNFSIKHNTTMNNYSQKSTENSTPAPYCPPPQEKNPQNNKRMKGLSYV